MSKALDIPGGYTLDLVMLPNDKMNEFNKFMTEYGNKSDRYLLNEIARVKTEVSQELLAQHLNNLDTMAKMQGLVTDYHKRRIDMVKRAISTPTQSSQNTNRQAAPGAQFFWAGSSLLLWFLILAAIWRRPYYRPYPYY